MYKVRSPTCLFMLLWLGVALGQLWAPLSVDADSELSMEVLLGTPPQPLSVALDYGTADLLVVPNRCTNGYCAGLADGAAFNVSSSKTLSLNRTFFTSEFLSGDSVSAFWAQDELVVGGHQIKNAVFAIRSDTNNQFYATSNITTSLKVRSTLGLGPRGLQNTVKWTLQGRLLPVYDNFMYSLNASRLAVWVDPTSIQEQTSGNGLLLLGGLDPALFDISTYSEVPLFLTKDKTGQRLQEPGVLGFEFDRLFLNYVVPGMPENSVITVSVSNSSVAVLDSRSGLRMPTPTLRAVAEALQAIYSYYADAYVVLCRNVGVFQLLLPNLYELEFSLSDFMSPLNATDSAGNALCTLDITAGDFLSLPNIVINQYFVAPDYETNRVGFARAVSPKQPYTPNVQQTYMAGSGTPRGILASPSGSVPAPTYNPSLSSRFQLTTAVIATTTYT